METVKNLTYLCAPEFCTYQKLDVTKLKVADLRVTTHIGFENIFERFEQLKCEDYEYHEI